jgi:ribonuclease HII
MIRFECRARQCGYQAVAGVDEAGRGPLAGPVVAAAVILPPDYRHPEINDSKQLTPGKRERLYEVIKADALAVGLGVVEAPVIDRVNILRATLMAMRDAVLDLSLPPDFVLVDGRNRIDVRAPQETIIGGDGKSISIAAASIIAKVSRDRIMEIYHRQFPQYNFMKNKGYGTGEHREAILRCGPCKIHRLSFAVKSSANHQPSLL